MAKHESSLNVDILVKSLIEAKRIYFKGYIDEIQKGLQLMFVDNNGDLAMVNGCTEHFERSEVYKRYFINVSEELNYYKKED